MFADQFDVGFLDDPSSLRRAIGVPSSGAKSIDFNFLDNELFSTGGEISKERIFTVPIRLQIFRQSGSSRLDGLRTTVFIRLPRHLNDHDKLDDACGVFSETEDYARMLFEWQQHIGLIGNDLVDFEDPLSGSCFKDGKFVPSFSDNAGATNSKEIAALQADDLDSLLTQFEASQAADWLLKECITPAELLVNKATEDFSLDIVDVCPGRDVIEEIIVDADDEAEYIDVEEVDDEIDFCQPVGTVSVDQRFVDLDHDYCLVIDAGDSEVDIEEDNLGDGLYNKIPSYYHETVLLRGNICSSPCPANVTEVVVVDDSPVSPLTNDPAADSGLYCRLPPYIAEGLPSGKPDYNGVTDVVANSSSSTHSAVEPALKPSSTTYVPLQSCTDATDQLTIGHTQLTDDVSDNAVSRTPNDGDLHVNQVADCASTHDNQITDCVSTAGSLCEHKLMTDPQADDSEPEIYGADDEYCRYYERQARKRHRHIREVKSRYNRYSSSRSPTRSCSSRSRSSSSSKSQSSSHCWDRSRSRSPPRSHRSRSRSQSRRKHRSRSRTKHRTQHRRSRSRSRSRIRSRSPSRSSCSSRSSSSRWEDKEERLREWHRNKMRPIEERRIIYVGNISSGTTRNDLRRRFSVFGPIEEVTVHFRDRGDDYGFVTFHYKVDAFEALAHGNDDRSQPQYELCFGGRRHFCQSRYADLDGLNANEQADIFPSPPLRQVAKKPVESDFDAMLRAAQASRKLQIGNS